MKVAVWDTYVQRTDGKTMHFDILVDSRQRNEEEIFSFGKDYLSSKPFATGDLTTRECAFCHIEQASAVLNEKIRERAYAIIEMENCQ